MKNCVALFLCSSILALSGCGSSSSETSVKGDADLANIGGPFLIKRGEHNSENEHCLTWVREYGINSIQWKKCADQAWRADNRPANSPQEIVSDYQIWTMDITSDVTALYQTHYAEEMRMYNGEQRMMGYSEYMVPFVGNILDANEHQYLMSPRIFKGASDMRAAFSGRLLENYVELKKADDLKGEHLFSKQGLTQYCLSNNLTAYGVFYKFSATYDLSGCAESNKNFWFEKIDSKGISKPINFVSTYLKDLYDFYNKLKKTENNMTAQ